VVFVLVGVPGFFVALALMVVIREPRRQLRGTHQNSSMKACFAHVGRHSSALVPLAVGMGTVALFGYGFTWLPTLFTRVWGWPPQRFSICYGIILLTLGPLGTVMGGIIANRLYDRGHRDAPFRVLSVSLPILVVVGGTAALWPNPWMMMAALAVSAFFSSMSTSAGVASVIFATPAHYRGRVLSLYTMTNSMIGTTLGPAGVGWLNDHVFGQGPGIRWSVASIMLVAGGGLTAYLLTARKGYARAVAELEAAD
jgi:MFS family permease